MFSIRTEKDCVVRWYKAENHWDAIELFHELSKVLKSVQVWKGDKLLMDYALI
jgi:hypothetical protein